MKAWRESLGLIFTKTLSTEVLMSKVPLQDEIRGPLNIVFRIRGGWKSTHGHNHGWRVHINVVCSAASVNTAATLTTWFVLQRRYKLCNSARLEMKHLRGNLCLCPWGSKVETGSQSLRGSFWTQTWDELENGWRTDGEHHSSEEHSLMKRGGNRRKNKNKHTHMHTNTSISDSLNTQPPRSRRSPLNGLFLCISVSACVCFVKSILMTWCLLCHGRTRVAPRWTVSLCLTLIMIYHRHG